MPFGDHDAGLDAVGVITPNRNLILEGDFAEPILAEPPFAHSRQRKEIKSAAGSVGVMQFSSGAWTLEPNPVSSVAQQDTTATLRLSQVSAAPGIQEVPCYVPPTDIPGATTGAGTGLASASTNYHFEPTINANASENDLPADRAAFPGPLANTNIEHNRCLVSNVHWGANHASLIRFTDFNNHVGSPDFIGTYYFGGPNIPVAAGGEMAAAFQGDGICRLYYRATDPTTHAVKWVELDSWRFAPPHQSAGHTQSMLLLPYQGPGGLYIEARSGVVDEARGPAGRNSYQQTFVQARGKSISLKPKWNLLGETAMIALTTDTIRQINDAIGAGVVRLDLPKDSRARVQINRVMYPDSGFLYDEPFTTPIGSSTAAPLVLSWTATGTDPTTIGAPTVTTNIYDADTNVALTEVGSSLTSPRKFTPNAGQNRYYVGFTLASNSAAIGLDPANSKAPYLWSYSVVKDGVFLNSRAPQWTTPVIAAATIGAGKDPQSGSGNVTLQDPTFALKKAYVRGDVPVRLVDRPDTGPEVEWMRGYLREARAHRIGQSAKQGFGGGGSDLIAEMQSRYWSEFNGSAIVPYYKRLLTAKTPARVNLVADPDPRLTPSANALSTPYKVSDIVAVELGWCGFTDDMIDVPDSSVRFWPAPGDSEDSLFIKPRQDVGPLIVAQLRDYLGWYLVWDGNAGTKPGMWRAKRAVVPDSMGAYSPIVTFVDEPPMSGFLSLSPDSYPTNTIPIIKGTFETWPVAPEGNLIETLGIAGEGEDLGVLHQFARNIVSSDFIGADGSPILSGDPDDPDYLGTTQLITIVDPGLTSWDAVNWNTRREYDLSCHCLQHFSFQCPAWYVKDTTDTITIRTRGDDGTLTYSTAPAYRDLGGGLGVQPRPLHFYDVATVPIRGNSVIGLITNVHLSNEIKDNQQLMIIEGVAAVPLTANA